METLLGSNESDCLARGKETKHEDLGSWFLASDDSGGGWRRRLHVSPAGPSTAAWWHDGVAWWRSSMVVR